MADDTGTERPEAVDKDRFAVARKTLVDGLKSHPVTSQGLTNYGTAILVNIINEAGGLPTHNFTSGRFDGAEAISGETVHQNCEDRGGKREHACMTGCVIHCSNVYNDKDGNYVSSGVEYETIWALGANCDNADIESIAQMDRLCDDLGLDTIEMGDTFGVAMEGGVLPWGDAARMIELFEDIRQGTELGRKLANGCVHAGAEFGVTRVPAVKGQGIPAYDPRAVKGIGVTYATSTMGADHTSGYAVATNILKVGGDVDPLASEGQCPLSALDQPDSLAAIPELISAQYGVPFGLDQIGPYGETLLSIERDFNRRAGFTEKDDRLPAFFSTERLPPHDVIWDIPDGELDQVCGWSPVLEM